MRRDLVAMVLAAASDRLFEDVNVQVGGGAPVLAVKAIDGIKPAAERIEMFGEKLRVGTHVTRGLKEKLPGLANGHLLINDKGTFRVMDMEPIGDGRFEIAISLEKVA